MESSALSQLLKLPAGDRAELAMALWESPSDVEREGEFATRDRGLSPDGKWMVYSKKVEGVTGLYLQERPSGTERLLDRGTRQP